MDALTTRFDAICERIAVATARSGRPAQAVCLVAVSKLHGADVVAELAAYWATRSSGNNTPVFGESYVQEACGKIVAVKELLARNAPMARPCWHFVGHVQSRKARDVVGAFELIHSVDSLKLATALQKAWRTQSTQNLLTPGQTAHPQPVLVQVNLGQETQKSGVSPDKLEDLLLSLAAMPELALQGLMCLPPLTENSNTARPFFALLRVMRNNMEKRCGLALPHLSMGMSDDFEAAIEEGATLVRIGTDIFGSRQPES